MNDATKRSKAHQNNDLTADVDKCVEIYLQLDLKQAAAFNKFIQRLAWPLVRKASYDYGEATLIRNTVNTLAGRLESAISAARN